jgi:hypothetical protein
MNVRRVTFTATLPVGNPDRGAEIEVEVTADVAMDVDDLRAAVVFVDPTLEDLENHYGDRTIDRLHEDAYAEAWEVESRERRLEEDRAALAGVLGGLS